jgi:hypothetical protein
MNSNTMRTWLGFGVLALMAAFVLSTGLAVTVSANVEAPCEGLACSKPSDCGTKCFCNNPEDKIGMCYLDEQ